MAAACRRRSHLVAGLAGALATFDPYRETVSTPPLDNVVPGSFLLEVLRAPAVVVGAVLAASVVAIHAWPLFTLGATDPATGTGSGDEADATDEVDARKK